jgi:H+/Na+-translocating ferredoxin:NAD+ oxidoreductase subunit E
VALKQVSSTDEFIKGLWRDNPVFIQVLGMCPALAVSNTAINALAMGAATTFVLVMAGLSVSLLRNFIPREARIVSYICIIATFVTCVDYAIMAISIELHRALGAFIALIVVNCLILGRGVRVQEQPWPRGDGWARYGCRLYLRAVPDRRGA